MQYLQCSLNRGFIHWCSHHSLRKSQHFLSINVSFWGSMKVSDHSCFCRTFLSQSLTEFVSSAVFHFIDTAFSVWFSFSFRFSYLSICELLSKPTRENLVQKSSSEAGVFTTSAVCYHRGLRRCRKTKPYQLRRRLVCLCRQQNLHDQVFKPY